MSQNVKLALIAGAVFLVGIWLYQRGKLTAITSIGAAKAGA